MWMLGFLGGCTVDKKADLVKRSTFSTQRIKLSKDEIRGRKELEEETNKQKEGRKEGKHEKSKGIMEAY